MGTVRTTAAALALGLVTGWAIAADQKAEKPVVSCEEIVKFYKDSHSVDETSGTLKVDQPRVVQCLRAAGIQTPIENDQ
jgi:hypothetical protein